LQDQRRSRGVAIVAGFYLLVGYWSLPFEGHCRKTPETIGSNHEEKEGVIMELLETNDSKSLLLKKSAKHKKSLEDEVKLLSENAEKIVTNALIIGGTLAVTYLLIRQFSKSKSKKKSKAKKIKLIKDTDANVEEASFENGSDESVVAKIGSAIAAQATVFLLGLANDKLSAFLQTNFQKKPNLRMSVLKTLRERHREGKKSIAVLVDPDKVDDPSRLLHLTNWRRKIV
jgi:hypothetical protein